jgi:hypothetical protein
VNLDRLRWGEWIAGIAGLNLLLVTFRAWYKVTGTGVRISAWDGLDNGRYLLIATAVVGIFLLLLIAAEQAEQLSFPPGGLAALVGLACTVYIAYRLATPPSDNLDADIGLYLGLVSSLGVAIGGLLSVREAAALPAYVRAEASAPGHGAVGTPTAPLGALVPDSGGTWSPAPPAPAPNWTPAAPVPPSTAAGAAMGAQMATADRPLQAGDEVALVAGGARFPAGTVARVVEVFGGGALVEVVAVDGLAERFEVPEQAYERLEPGSGARLSGDSQGESWSPAMPAPANDASEDWGFDEASAGAGTAVAEDEPAAAETAEAPKDKVPFWKREIGGKKKRGGDDLSPAEVGAASALAAAPIAEAATAEERPGFFKRVFGGGKATSADSEEATEAIEADTPHTPEPEVTPATDVAGVGTAAESDTAIAESAPEPEPEAASAVEESPAAVEPEPAVEDVAAQPEPIAAPPEPEPEVVVTPEPAPEAPDPEPEAVEAAEPDVAAPEPEPEASPPELEPVVEPEPEVVPEPEPVVEAEPEPEAAAPEPEVVPEPEPVVEADPEPEVVPEPEPDAAEEPQPKPKRKRSSGSRKVPKEALAAAAGIDAPPTVGDTIQLKVSGGKYDAGAVGTVVDVFSAGVIVELTTDDGRTERLDLPFEAVGPADA